MGKRKKKRSQKGKPSVTKSKQFLLDWRAVTFQSQKTVIQTECVKAYYIEPDTEIASHRSLSMSN